MPLGKEVGLGPGHVVVTQPPQQPLPTFGPVPIVAKRWPISAITAELLLNVLSAWSCLGSALISMKYIMCSTGMVFILNND